jgi:type 1 glutamine amidotransferase
MKLLLMTGGPTHPYERSTPILEGFLINAGHEVIVREDSDALSDGTLSNMDALVFNTSRWDTHPLEEHHQNSMADFISSGKGFVCIHISGATSDSWPEYSNITGGGWNRGNSHHPPYEKFHVDVSNSNHICANGLSGFDTYDERYMNIDFIEGNDVFLTVGFEGGVFEKNVSGNPAIEMPLGTFPIGWTRTYGKGKVFVTLLGHDDKSQGNDLFQKIILNGVDWVTH